MWLFTSFGFFSIVRKDDDTQLTIRSRTRGDLVRLRQHYLPQASAPEGHAGTDYPWRMRCHEDDLARALPRLVHDIDYANFKDEVAQVTGKARAKRYGQVWQALYGMDEDLPEPEPDGWQGLPWPQKSPVGKPRAFGGVVVAPDGRLLLREVAGHYDGYVWSFAKGRPEPDESPRATALREVQEEMGVQARILLPLPGTYGGTTTRSHFFLMLADPAKVDLTWRSRETLGLRWVLPEEAQRLIEQTTHPTGRQRDLAVLHAALQSLPSPLPLRRPIARREDNGTRPLPARRTTLRYERSFTPEEMAHVARGFVPTMMEQKWFAYLEDGVLHFHRSWTGLEIYRLHLEPEPGKAGHWRVREVEVNRHPGQYEPIDGLDELEVLGNLVEEMLLRFGEEPEVDGFVQAVLALGQPNYLGKPPVVEGLVNGFFQALLKTLQATDSHEELEVEKQRIVAAMTDDPDYTRMPWHSREQLGVELIHRMNLDPARCEGQSLAFVVSDALDAVIEEVFQLARDIEADEHAQWEREGLETMGRMARFVVSTFLGTASLGFRNETLRDFSWA